MTNRVGVAWLVVSAVLTTSVQGQGAQRATAPYLRAAGLVLSVATADARGHTYGAKSLMTPLTVGESSEISMRVGEVGRDPCAVQLPEKSRDASFKWSVTSKLLSLWSEGATVAVTFSRASDPALGQPFERTRTLELREGEPLIIDYVVLPLAVGVAGRPNCEAMTVRLELKFQDDPAVANAAMAYDIWLVHDDATGRHTEQFRTVAGQGKEAEFFFAPRTYAVQGAPVEISITGRVKGRARPDGRIDLLVLPSRAVTAGSSVTASGGAREVTVAQGDTLEVELPAAPAEGPGAVPKPVGTLLSSQRTAIRITVSRLR